MAKKRTKTTRKKKKLLVIYHGGTIGMKAVPKELDGRMVQVLAPPESDADFSRACTDAFEAWPDSGEFEVHYEFMTSKDSMNVFMPDWTALIYRVAKAQDDEGYDAVIIAHGTDTMAYTATALGFGLHGPTAGKSGLRIPVIITGSQLPLSSFGGDGRTNLERAFMAARTAVEGKIADVLLVFGASVLLGTRALKRSEREFEAFHAPIEVGRVGQITAYGVELFAERLHQVPRTTPKLNIAPNFSKGVQVVELGPGTEPGAIQAAIQSGHTQAVVLKSPGEGNLPTDGESNFLPFIQWATEAYGKFVPVVLASQFIGGGTGGAHYEVGQAPLKAGAVPAFDLTHVAAEVKLRWLLSLGVRDRESLIKAMKTSYAGEVTVVA